MRLAHLYRAACIALSATLGSGASAEQITVFAAASLRDALDAGTAAFTAQTGHEVRLSYAASSALARQIERGAPADLFISANQAWMSHLEQGRQVDPNSLFELAGNRLVLIAHGTGAEPLALSSDLDLRGLLGVDRLAMALVDAVPAGLYGKAALETLGLWESVADRVAQTDNARTALALVAQGHAAYGVVYATDAQAEPRVSVAATFPSDSHHPITYPAAIVTGRDRPTVQALMQFLKSDEMGAILRAQGFEAPG